MQDTEVTDALLCELDGEESRQQLFALIYTELKRRAGRILAQHQNPSLSATALVHEVYLKLVAAPLNTCGRDHFFSLAARAMRQIMVDHARRRLQRKRDRRLQVSLSEGLDQPTSLLTDLLGIDCALDRLKREDQDLVEIVQLHFFGGLSFAAIAELKCVSLSTVEREWRTARALLRVYC